MKFATPIALVLLLTIPYFVWLGWPRLAYRRKRDLASLALRLIIVLMVVFGLAGLQIVRAAGKLAVVFLIDASDSIDSSERALTESYVRQAMSKMGPDDRAGIVVFGKNALVERPMSITKDLNPIASVPVRLETDISGAMHLGLAMFPADSAKRIVLLTDGIETSGNATEAARLAAASGVQIDVVPLHRQAGPEVLVSDFRAPSIVNEGQILDLGVTVQSTVATSATLTILSAGSVIQSKPVDLKVGTNNFVVSLKAPRQGFTDFKALIQMPGGADTFYQNNELSTFTQVTGPPRILLITSKQEEIAALLPALQQTGVQVEVRGPNDLPIGLAALADYKAVVLANVSATDLTEQRMNVLKTYVHDLGGGLIAIGGPNSYGVGGYFQTPLEEVLPVDMQIKDQKRIPKLTMVYVIDRSGSMEEVVPGNSMNNLELAKEATRRSINFLFPRDRAGVLSFDSDPQWLVPINYVTDRQTMVNNIGTLRPGGGTDIYAAVKKIAETLPSDPSTLKHVILLTDGGADPTGIVEMVRAMHDTYGITVTSIGIGTEVPDFMKDIATAGHGIYYNLTNPQNIPQIFAAETVLATRSYIVEQEFTPTLTANSQIMRGIDTVPTLLGYVATTPKNNATVILTAPGYNDPLLASWQYGLGRAVAWTSDATTRWSKNWVGWDGFQRFWSQVVRSTIIEGVNNNLEAHVEQRNGHYVLVADARDDKGAFINGLSLQASAVDPSLQGQSIGLKQVAPGRYEAEFDPQTQGAYFFRIVGAGSFGGTDVTVAQTTGWVLSYSPEYRLHDTNVNLLDDIANLTNGKSITEKPEFVFVHDLQAEQAAFALWPWLLLAAILLFPVDIAIRRVIVSRSDLRKLNAWLRQRFGIRDRVAMMQASSARMSQLMGAKERAMPPKPSESTDTPTIAADGSVNATQPSISTAYKLPTVPAATARRQPFAASAKTTSAPTLEAAPPKSTEPTLEGSGSLASRLIEKRRKHED